MILSASTVDRLVLEYRFMFRVVRTEDRFVWNYLIIIR